jgi:hypothetical protein
MRRAARTDSNQMDIVAALRKAGASVTILSSVGHGVPDLLVGHRGENTLMEVKDSEKPPSQRKLTPDEQAWHDAWRGNVWIVESVKEALEALESM